MAVCQFGKALNSVDDSCVLPHRFVDSLPGRMHEQDSQQQDQIFWPKFDKKCIFLAKIAALRQKSETKISDKIFAQKHMVMLGSASDTVTDSAWLSAAPS